MIYLLCYNIIYDVKIYQKYGKITKDKNVLYL